MSPDSLDKDRPIHASGIIMQLIVSVHVNCVIESLVEKDCPKMQMCAVS